MFEAGPARKPSVVGRLPLAWRWQPGRPVGSLSEGFMSKHRWRSLAVGALAALGLWGCGNGVPEPQAIQNRVALTSFSGENACADLEQYIEDTAVLDMRTQLQAARDNVWGWGWFGGVDDAARTAEAGAPAPSAAGGPSAYTTTNTQVAGVDEADFVKNDGTRIFVLSGQTLYATKSWPAAEMQLVGKLQIEGWPREMFLDDQNRLVVFSSVWLPHPLEGDEARCMALGCYYYGSNTVKVTVVDVSDLSNLKATQSFYLPGDYSNSRRIGSSVRLVLSDRFRYPRDVKWHPDYSRELWEDKQALARMYDHLIAENEKKIRARTLRDWLPAAKASVNGELVEVGYDCSSFYKSNAPTRLGLVTVATLNLDRPGHIGRTSIIGEAGEVYASKSSLYVANRHWWWWPRPGQSTATYLHKFDITQPDNAVYVASGKVDGHIVDQFSMDEDEKGYFRVATTVMTRLEDPQNRWRMETTNLVQVLGEDAGALKVVGRSPELAKGERIFSARFVGKKGYVVTFRNIDPLFTFDLSDPTNPRVVGELKVPGFSSYIHPIDESHLLTIGTYLPEGENVDWRARRLQLAIFDVSDMANPKQKFVQTVGTASSYSEAQYEHKAFNYFPQKKLLAIPFFDWSYQARSADEYWFYFISDLRVFHVDPSTGFTPKGALSMKDLYRVHQDYGWTWYWQPMVRRSVMADDFVYAISDAGIRVAHVDSLSTPLATVTFDKVAQR